MEFVDYEVQSRVKNVESKSLHSIANTMEPPLYNLDELSKENFAETSRFNVKVDDVDYECLMSNSQRKRLYVFLSNNYKIGTEGRRKQALFFRMTWHRYFPGVCLNIEDPMIKKFANIAWGGYFGDSKSFYVNGVVSIVEKIANIYGISNEQIVFIGLSSAGFAALHASVKMPCTECVVENPQIYVENWTNIERLEKALKLDFREEKYRERLSLDTAIINNKKSRFCIFCNSASELDFDKQVKPFLAKLGILDLRYNSYHIDNIEIYFLDTPNGHISWLSPLSVYMATCFRDFPDMEKEYILSMIRDMNREKYYLRGLTVPTNSNKLYRYLVTARIDIKNKGNANSVEISKYESNDVRIVFPDWYNDASGKGCMIIGRDGVISSRIKCIGDGKLYVFLRGVDVRDKQGGRLPFWITFIELKINDVDVLDTPCSVWHDRPFLHIIDVKDGDVFDLQAQWKIYPYSPDELERLSRKIQ